MIWLLRTVVWEWPEVWSESQILLALVFLLLLALVGWLVTVPLVRRYRRFPEQRFGSAPAPLRPRNKRRSPRERERCKLTRFDRLGMKASGLGMVILIPLAAIPVLTVLGLRAQEARSEDVVLLEAARDGFLTAALFAAILGFGCGACWLFPRLVGSRRAWERTYGAYIRARTGYDSVLMLKDLVLGLMPVWIIAVVLLTDTWMTAGPSGLRVDGFLSLDPEAIPYEAVVGFEMGERSNWPNSKKKAAWRMRLADGSVLNSWDLLLDGNAEEHEALLAMLNSHGVVVRRLDDSD